MAVVHDELVRRRIIDGEVAGRRLVVSAKPRTASALDASLVAEGRDVSATGVFARPPKARAPLRSGRGHFPRPRDGQHVGRARAIAGPLAGQSLGPVEHVDTFWFAWAAFRPDTVIVP